MRFSYGKVKEPETRSYGYLFGFRYLPGFTKGKTMILKLYFGKYFLRFTFNKRLI